MRYNLKEFNSIMFNGFEINLPDETLAIISELSHQVGSPNYVKTPVFAKRELPKQTNESSYISSSSKKKRSKNAEMSSEDWEAIRNFQATKIEQKTGIDASIDLIRSYLNKITDKNYSDYRGKIVDLVGQIMENYQEEDIMRVGSVIFEIASTNRFYSRMYADLYSDLIQQFQYMKTVLENNFNTYLNLFDNIKYCDPNTDYDGFCNMNKTNEKRKSLSAFFVNLMNNDVLTPLHIVKILKNLLEQVYHFIKEENKKNEVDEITENIALLYTSKLFEDDDYDDITIEDMTIVETVEYMASCKSKDYASLSNKSVFRYMDIVEQ